MYLQIDPLAGLVSDRVHGLGQFGREHGTKFPTANQEKMSPKQELVEDLMAMVHTFFVGCTARETTRKNTIGSGRY